MKLSEIRFKRGEASVRLQGFGRTTSGVRASEDLEIEVTPLGVMLRPRNGPHQWVPLSACTGGTVLAAPSGGKR